MARKSGRNGRTPYHAQTPQPGGQPQQPDAYEEYDEYYDEKEASRRAGKGCLMAVLIVLAVVLVVGLVAFFIIKADVDGKNATATEETVALDITKGSGASKVGQQLEELGLIKYPFVYRMYVRFFNSAPYHEGRFRLTPGMSYDEIIDVISKEPPPREEVSVMIPPGSNVYQFASRMEKAGLCSADDFVAEANNIDAFTDIEFFKHLDYDENTFMKAEGYLAPNTFTFYADDDVHNYVRKLYEQMNADLKAIDLTGVPGYAEGDTIYTLLEKKGLTLRQFMTMASIVEKEASAISFDDKKMVAGVFSNRIHKDISGTGMGRRTLGCDSIDLYVTEWMASQYDGVDNIPPAMFSAYYSQDADERSNEGLPAGPICSPGPEALAAALNPTEHNYFFFVNNKEGATYYSYDYTGHQANIARVQQENAAYDAQNPSAAVPLASAGPAGVPAQPLWATAFIWPAALLAKKK